MLCPTRARSRGKLYCTTYTPSPCSSTTPEQGLGGAGGEGAGWGYRQAISGGKQTRTLGQPGRSENIYAECQACAQGQSPSGGLNERGRKSYERANPGSDLKAPQPEGGPRKKSFCARMRGMKRKLTSAKTANDPDSRINKSLRKWKC